VINTSMSGKAIEWGANQAGQPAWPVASGLVPPLADCYTPRTETGLSLADSLKPGETVVLVAADDVARTLGGLGGTGKTQLAAAIAHALWDQRAVDLVVWVTAAGRDAVITSYAQALADLGAPDAGEGPEPAAAHLLAWLAGTRRPWLVVLDDLTDPATLDQLWPWGASGRVLVTTNRPDTALAARSPRLVEVGVFSRREALTYLSTKLHSDPDQWVGALELATELGFLPIALGQAGALMAETGIDCREYRSQIAEGPRRPQATPAGSYHSTVVATGELALERADRLPPAGLARPAAALIALLDPNGIPGAVLTSQAACAFLTRVRGASVVDEIQARTAVHNLARVGLATVDTTSTARTVRVHPLAQATVWHNLSAAGFGQAGRAAADALLQAWPRHPVSLTFEQALRDCTAKLRELTGVLLWSPETHPVLLRAGRSLDTAGLVGPAVAYWQMMTDISGPALGAEHPHTIFVRDRLAAASEAAGHLDDAIALYERLLAEREQGLGAGHPDTLSTWSSLAHAYRAAGRTADAVQLAEHAVAESERANGPLHPDTLTARADLGHAYLSTGLTSEAIAVFERTLAGREQVLGPGHLDTLSARGNLAHAYRAAGRLKDAVPLYQRTLADRERLQGPDHPDTMTARGNLAAAYRAAGRLKDAIPVYRRTLADRERLQGPDHPDTMTARGNLADTYHSARKLKDAVPLYQRTLADRERVQGPDHPDTITARGNLASAYHSARKLVAALPLYERTLADCERVLGPDHPDTLASRGNLAHAYHTAGRQAESLAMFERTLSDCERVLGHGHPLTQAARETYEALGAT
jgi:tetratricopeptide (TPR) repeat protein